MLRLTEQAKTINHLISAVRTPGTVDGTGVDTTGFDGVRMTVPCSAFTGSTVDCKLQESDDNSVFTDITGAAMAQQSAGTPIPTVDVRLGGRANKKKYVRARLVTAGGTNATAGVILDLYAPDVPPVVNTPVSVNA